MSSMKNVLKEIAARSEDITSKNKPNLLTEENQRGKFYTNLSIEIIEPMQKLVLTILFYLLAMSIF